VLKFCRHCNLKDQAESKKNVEKRMPASGIIDAEYATNLGWACPPWHKKEVKK
jgi:hypothetical protein